MNTTKITAPQPAQATQAEVTDEQIKEAAVKAVKERNLSWVWFEKDDQDKYTIPILSESHYQLVRAGLTLRPERVPMTDTQLCEALNIDGSDDWTYQVRDAVEAHHRRRESSDGLRRMHKLWMVGAL